MDGLRVSHDAGFNLLLLISLIQLHDLHDYHRQSPNSPQLGQALGNSEEERLNLTGRDHWQKIHLRLV